MSRAEEVRRDAEVSICNGSFNDAGPYNGFWACATIQLCEKHECTKFTCYCEVKGEGDRIAERQRTSKRGERDAS